MIQKNKSNKLLLINMISSGLFQLLMLVVPLITTPYVARIFTPYHLGIYAASYSVASLFVTFSMIGLPIYGARRIAQINNIVERTRVFFNLWVIQILCSFICFFFFNGLVVILHLDKIYYVQSFLILATMFDISWFYIGLEEIRKNLLRNLVTKILATLSIFILIKSPTQLEVYAVINIIAVFCGNLTMFSTLRPYVEFKRKHFKIYFRKKVVTDSFRLMIPMILDNLKNTSSRVILSNLSGNYQVGIFDQGSKIIVIILGIVTSTSNAVSPRMSYLVEEKQITKMRSYFEKFIVLISVFSTITISGIIAVAEYFIPIFLGGGYDEVIPILVIGSFLIMFGTYNVFLMNGMIIPFSLDRELVKTSLASLIVIVLLNFLLVPILGSIGSALGLVISNITLTILYCWILKGYLELIKIVKYIFSSLLIILSVSIVIILSKIYISFSSLYTSFIFYGLYSFILSSLLSFIMLKLFKIKMYKRNNE